MAIWLQINLPHNTNQNSKNMRRDYYEEEYDDSFYEDERTYERYNGSYAQDVEGWSDQDIDDVFDGDPGAYWNID